MSLFESKSVGPLLSQLDLDQADHIKIYGGGGGTILPDEIKELHK